MTNTSPIPPSTEFLRTHLANILCDVGTLVHTLETLYMSSETVDLMNKAASSFFAQHQRMLVDTIFLELTKLYDPKGSRYGLNVSLPHLVDLLERDDLTVQLVESRDSLGKLLLIRNKLIAHNDAKYIGSDESESLETVKDALQRSKDLFNACFSPNFDKLNPDRYPAKLLMAFLQSTAA